MSKVPSGRSAASSRSMRMLERLAYDAHVGQNDAWPGRHSLRRTAPSVPSVSKVVVEPTPGMRRDNDTGEPMSGGNPCGTLANAVTLSLGVADAASTEVPLGPRAVT